MRTLIARLHKLEPRVQNMTRLYAFGHGYGGHQTRLNVAMHVVECLVEGIKQPRLVKQGLSSCNLASLSNTNKLETPLRFTAFYIETFAILSHGRLSRKA